MASEVTTWRLEAQDNISGKLGGVEARLRGLETRFQHTGKAAKAALDGAGTSGGKLGGILNSLGNKAGGFIDKLRGMGSGAAGGRISGMLQGIASSATGASGALGSLGPVVGRLGTMLGSLGPYGAIAGAALAVLSAAAIPAALGAQKAAGFSHEFRQLSNLNLDKATGQIDKLKGSVLDLSFDKGINSSAMNMAFFDLQSITGKYGKEVEDVAAKVGDFSKAYLVDFNKQVQGTGKAMRSFSFGAEGIDRFLASSVKTVQVGVTTFEQLADVRTEYLDAVAGAGMDYESGDKLFALFSQGAKSVDIAATLTKSAFEGLTDGNTTKQLKRLGIDVFDPVTGKVRELGGIVKDMVPVFGKMSDQKFAATRDAIGGPEGLAMLLNKVRASGTGVVEVFDQFDNATVDTQKALAGANKDAVALWEVAKNRLGVSLIKIGEKVLPTITSGLETANQVMLALSGHTDGVSESAANLATVLGTIGSVAGSVGTALKYAFMPVTALYDAGKFVVDGISGLGTKDEFLEMVEGAPAKAAYRQRLQMGARYSSASRKGVDAFVDEGAALGMDTADPEGLLLGLRGRLAGTAAGTNLEAALAKGGPKAEAMALKMVAASAARYQEKSTGPAAKAGGIPPALPGTSLGGSSTGQQAQAASQVVAGGQRVQHITVNIGKLHDSINITTNVLQESSAQITAVVEEALIRAVRNSEAHLGE